jgi:phenylalanyl-tRNA synthetase beta chain
MLCLEGIARALNIFKGKLEAPQYRLADMKGELQQQQQQQ